MATLLSIATALFAGLMMTRLFNRFKLPDVTAYLIAGILAGPFVLGRLGIPGLGFVSSTGVEALSVFSDVALGFIAFSIGSEFNLTALRKTGRQAAIIGIVQAVFTTVVVDLAMIGIHFLMPQTLSLPAAITLGAIAAATAPAATLMVVRQYKAKGELTSLLLPIVALDDAVGLIVFAVSFGIAKALSSGRADLISILIDPLLEIVLSLLLGAAAGMVLKKLETMFHFQLKPSVLDDHLYHSDCGPFHALVQNRACNNRFLLFAGLHDAGNAFCQHFSACGRSYGPR